MDYAVLIDFGSTFTKVAAVSLKEQRLLLTDKFPSTVRTDARIALGQCFEASREALGEKNFQAAHKIASSSAAGGLRMAVIGLTQTLSLKAGRNAAFGAGAKIVLALDGKITEQDVEKISSTQTEIVLFCGGYEGGNSSIILHNAEMLASSSLRVPIVYAGNSAVAQEVRRKLMLSGHECFIVSNVIPQVGLLDVAMAEGVIRDIFMQRIVDAKGLSRVRKDLDGLLMPTPAAVLTAGELLARGTSTRQGVGDLIILDIGGATTDVHSFAEHVSYKGAKLSGANEPYKKRTVEGDLGMRESSNSLASEITIPFIAEQTGLTESCVGESIQMRVQHNHFVPNNDEQCAIDLALAQGAAKIASRRHAGNIEPMHSVMCKFVQKGKNLSGVRTVIGTGGPILNSLQPAAILKSVLVDRTFEPDVLLPTEAQLLQDKDYLLYAGGLIASFDKDSALNILLNSIRPIN